MLNTWEVNQVELSERKKLVLSNIVEQYIATGAPVGSKAVCSALDSACSSATVRNEMSELIELGFLVQPHTSAGRIPSNKGFRFYVSSLMKKYKLSDRDKQFIDNALPQYVDNPDDFMVKAGTVLANITRCAAVTTVPVDKDAALSKVEVIPMGRGILLLAVLTSSGMIKNRVCHCDVSITSDDADLFVKVINKAFSGKKLCNITPAKVQTLAPMLGDKMLALSSVLNGFFLTVQDFVDIKYRFEGETNLLFRGDMTEENLLNILGFLSRKESLSQILKRVGEKTEVLIGEETDEEALSSAAIISAGYAGSSHMIGKIAIIGPTRLDYFHYIPSIEYFASAIEKILLKNI